MVLGRTYWVLFGWMAAFCACSSPKPAEGGATARYGQQYDTICFGGEVLRARYQAILTVPGSKFSAGYLLLPSAKGGHSVWPDSLYYLKTYPGGWVAVGTFLGIRPSLVRYDGSTIREEVVATNDPLVRVYQTSRLEVVHIIDTVYSFGTTSNSHIFYAIDTAGRVEGPVAYFPTRWEDENGKLKPYEFTITAAVEGDSVVVRSEGKIEKVWR